MVSPSLRRRTAAFTLVEVTLALGIVAFAFVALLALLPAGNVAFRRAIDLSTCSQIAQHIIADAQNADFDTLTQAKVGGGVSAGNTVALDWRYFDDQGREIVPLVPRAPSPDEIRHAVYWVNTRVMQIAPLPRNADRTTRGADKTLGQTDPLNPMAQITVQVVHNPNILNLVRTTSAANDPSKPDRNLVADSRSSKVQLDIFTYSAMVGRNN